MSKENNLTDFLTDIADSLRKVTETTEEIKAQDFSNVIATMSKPNLIEGVAYENGEYIAEEMGADGFSKFTVDVAIPIPSPPVLIDKIITENGTYDAADDNADGYSNVTVNVPTSGEDMLQARVSETKNCHDLMYYYYGTNPDIIKNLNTTGVTNMYQMFGYCKELTSLNVSNLNTSQVTDMAYMFLGCSKLETLDVSNFDTKNVTKMNNMFQECRTLTSLDISNFDTSQIEGFNMQAMFNQCTNLQTVILPQNFVSNKITQINSMFSQCQSLKEIDLSVFDVSNVKYVSNLFQSCKSLISLDLGSWDTSKWVALEKTFYGCSALETITGTLDLISVTGTITDAFRNCSALTTFTLKNIKKTGLTIGSGTSYGHLLTLDTLINTVKELWDYSSGTTTYKLIMGSANLEKIANTYVKLITPTEEMIAADPNIESKMPCEVCESTDEGAMLLEDYAYAKSWTLA